MTNSSNKPLTFVEANDYVANNKSEKKYQVTLCMSGVASPLLPFIMGEISRCGYSPLVDFIPFGTLGQCLNESRDRQAVERNEIWLVFPWDIVPILDWRMGGRVEVSIDILVQQALDNINKIAQRKPSQIVYVDAVIPPIGLDASASDALKHFFRFHLKRIGAIILNENIFSLNKYLITGFPIEGVSAGEVAFNLMINLSNRFEPKKVLITDLDNTFWHGVAAEDGSNGIKMGPEGPGYKHFIYQSYLCQLQSLGVIVAAVTRNSENIIDDVFKNTSPSFKKEKFSVIIASYESKSAQIEELSRVMNLSLDSFVFVDDNPIEIQEVSQAIPSITSIMFPNNASEIPALLQELSNLFDRKVVTSEDRSRTEKYKLMLSGLKVKKSKSADMGDFLKSLNMKLFIRSRSRGNWDRALQLINKTNQFSANGIRLEEYDFDRIISNGGKIYTAQLQDCNGDHGEIVSCLIDGESNVVSLVMSCRVFQRTVEHSFLKWLVFNSGIKNLKIPIKKTDKNEPFITFLLEHGVDVISDEFEVLLSDTFFSEKLKTTNCHMEVSYEG